MPRTCQDNVFVSVCSSCYADANGTDDGVFPTSPSAAHSFCQYIAASARGECPLLCQAGLHITALWTTMIDSYRSSMTPALVITATCNDCVHLRSLSLPLPLTQACRGPSRSGSKHVAGLLHRGAALQAAQRIAQQERGLTIVSRDWC